MGGSQAKDSIRKLLGESRKICRPREPRVPCRAFSLRTCLAFHTLDRRFPSVDLYPSLQIPKFSLGEAIAPPFTDFFFPHRAAAAFLARALPASLPRFDIGQPQE